MSVPLDCEVTGTGTITYRWEVNVNGGQWIIISNSNSAKLVRRLEESQQYRCVVSNEFGITRSNIATITVLSKCASISILGKLLNIFLYNRDHHSSSRSISSSKFSSESDMYFIAVF